MRTGMTRPPGMALAQVLGLQGQVDAFIAGRAAAGAVAIRCRVRDQDFGSDRVGAVYCAAGWPKTGGSASRTPRCGTAWSPLGAVRPFDGYVLRDLDTGLVPVVGIPRPTRRRPASPTPSPPTWIVG